MARIVVQPSSTLPLISDLKSEAVTLQTHSQSLMHVWCLMATPLPAEADSALPSYLSPSFALPRHTLQEERGYKLTILRFLMVVLPHLHLVYGN
jgi:hypothetical protein